MGRWSGAWSLAQLRGFQHAKATRLLWAGDSLPLGFCGGIFKTELSEPLPWLP